jgi:hypothetical protein
VVIVVVELVLLQWMIQNQIPVVGSVSTIQQLWKAGILVKAHWVILGDQLADLKEIA